MKSLRLFSMEIQNVAYPEGFTPDRQHLIDAQKSLCELKDLPFFAPADGMCYHCRRDCVTLKWETEHITSCPKCNYAFND